MSKNQHGFTLLELSIVLVIIALVVGGVLVGKELVNSAGIRSQISQVGQYSLAVKTFKIKTGTLPGDLSVEKAANFGLRARITIPQNDNLLLDAYDSDGTQYGYISQEHDWFFHHLGAYKLINGQYAPVGYDINGIFNGSSTYQAGLTHPAMAMNKSYGIIPYTNDALGGPVWLMFGARNGTGMFWIASHTAASMSPIEAYQLDKKSDDGVPSAGHVRAIKFVNHWADTPSDQTAENDDVPATNCVRSAAALEYKADTTAVTCTISVKID